jgi:NCAIR mutase (PurE)-related protein
MSVDIEYFRTERVTFQNIMGDSKYTPEQVSNALRGLVTVYMKLTLNPAISQEDLDAAEILMQSASIEHDRRLAYRLVVG